METFIKLYRKSLKSSVFENPIFWKVWCWCLMRATFKEKNHPFNGNDIILKEGQFITGRFSACKELKISEQNYRTSINYLKSTSRITIKSTNKFSVISVLKWEEYQGSDLKITSKITSKITNHQPATNQPLTTNKNDKKENNDKDILIKEDIDKLDKELPNIGKAFKIFLTLKGVCLCNSDLKWWIDFSGIVPSDTDFVREAENFRDWWQDKSLTNWRGAITKWFSKSNLRKVEINNWNPKIYG